MNDLPNKQTICATALVDSDHQDIVAFARTHAQGSSDRDCAISLYLSVRDTIRYDPYQIDLSEEGMRASTALRKGHGWCVTKAALLAAVCRAAGLHARLGYADVRNHLSTERLRRAMQTDVFIWHGYTDIWLNGRWIKATPAFNMTLCERFGLLPLEFDGENDSLYHPYDKAGQRHMEYVAQRGVFNDMPLTQISEDIRRLYGRLMAAHEDMGNASFDSEAQNEGGSSTTPAAA
jgi:transglutaminase-like putative cysteine protease